MAHDHHHHHAPVAEAMAHLNRAFYAGIGLNFLFVLVEAGTGLCIHSLSLLSDAGHNLADVASLALSLLAFRLLRVKPNEQYTYGYRKTTILVALFNGMVLLVSIGAIVYEALHRLLQPEPLPGLTISLVAGVGIVVNSVTALLFLRDKDSDLNVKSAYLHLLADAIVSFGLVIGGIILYYTGWQWIDPALSILVALVILKSTWTLMRHSLRLSMDGVPPGMDIGKIKTEALKIKGLRGFHHLHIWAISTTQNALTAHLVLEPSVAAGEIRHIKEELRHLLLHFGIQHATLETETEGEGCSDLSC